MPSSVSEFGINAFHGCTGLESISIPGPVKIIEESLFEGCVKLKSFILPETVTTIESRAFYGCSSLETLNLPKSVGTGIELNVTAFWGCSNLNEITLRSGHARLCSIDGCLYERAGDKLYMLYYPEGKKNSSFEIAKNTIMILGMVFRKSEHLCSLIINSELERIANCAFEDCPNLTKIYIAKGRKYDNLPAGVEIIEY